jgi:uncharacterized membrane protein
MENDSEQEQEQESPERRSGLGIGGLPIWLTIVVVLVLLGLLVWNITIVGPEGLGTTYVLGGLLGAYAGVDHLIKRNREDR